MQRNATQRNFAAKPTRYCSPPHRGGRPACHALTSSVESGRARLAGSPSLKNTAWGIRHCDNCMTTGSSRPRMCVILALHPPARSRDSTPPSPPKPLLNPLRGLLRAPGAQVLVVCLFVCLFVFLKILGFRRKLLLSKRAPENAEHIS